MGTTTTAEQLFSDIAADVHDSFVKSGTDIVESVKQDLGVPVEIKTGPRGGRVVVRSKSGEPPRRETGLLQSQITQTVDTNGMTSTLTIESPIEYSKYLDPLSDVGLRDRPILAGVPERFEDHVLEGIANAISRKV